MSGCAAPRPVAPAPAAARSVPLDDQQPIEWARGERHFVVVRRSCRTLSVYERGRWVRTYGNVSFGRVPGNKQHQGDKRTPAGLYKIVGRRVHPRWSRFLLLDYPNLQDRAAHQEEFAAGRVTWDAGGDVGIHGSDEPVLNQQGVDWTLGCVSLLNADVRELYDLVPDGTLVLIEE